MPHGLPAATTVATTCRGEMIDLRTSETCGFCSVPQGRHVTILHAAADQDGFLDSIVVKDPARTLPRALVIPRAHLRL